MKRILIIDDEEPMRTTIKMVLEASGFETLQAESGEQGLMLAREHLPDLTLCDVNMPQMDGKSVLQSFRADPDLATRSFVMMTGNPDQTPQRVGMNLGADDYLIKPFKATELLQCVETRLKRAELHWRVEGRTLQELGAALHSVLPHEFFTPLAGIIGLSEVLKEEAGQLSRDEIVDYATGIERSARRLHRTLRNYLKIFSLDQKDAAAKPVSRPDPPGADEARAMVETNARAVAIRHKRSADLESRLQPCSPCIDPDSLALLTEELVENACSFSRQGTVILVEFFSDPNGSVLRVSDQGRGMTQEQIDRVGAFRQFDRKLYEQQGLGLGLTLVGRLLHQAGGTLTLKSIVGEGTSATVHLPNA